MTLSSKEMLKQMLVSNCATCNVFVKVSSIFTGDFVVTLYHRFPRWWDNDRSYFYFSFHFLHSCLSEDCTQQMPWIYYCAFSSDQWVKNSYTFTRGLIVVYQNAACLSDFPRSWLNHKSRSRVLLSLRDAKCLGGESKEG